MKVTVNVITATAPELQDPLHSYVYVRMYIYVRTYICM